MIYTPSLLETGHTERIPGPLSRRDCEVYLQALIECRDLCYESYTGLTSGGRIQERINEAAAAVDSLPPPSGIVIREIPRSGVTAFLCTTLDPEEERQRASAFRKGDGTSGIFSRAFAKLFGPPAAAVVLFIAVPWLIAG